MPTVGACCASSASRRTRGPRPVPRLAKHPRQSANPNESEAVFFERNRLEFCLVLPWMDTSSKLLHATSPAASWLSSLGERSRRPRTQSHRYCTPHQRRPGARRTRARLKTPALVVLIAAGLHNECGGDAASGRERADAVERGEALECVSRGDGSKEEGRKEVREEHEGGGRDPKEDQGAPVIGWELDGWEAWVLPCVIEMGRPHDV